MRRGATALAAPLQWCRSDRDAAVVFPPMIGISMPPRIRAWRLSVAVLTVIGLAACENAEEKKMKKLAGTYAFSSDTTEGVLHITEREELKLGADGRWTSDLVGHIGDEVIGGTDGSKDSGTYRIVDGMLSLRSLAHPGGLSKRYTISGDTLYTADAGIRETVTSVAARESWLARER